MPFEYSFYRLCSKNSTEGDYFSTIAPCGNSFARLQIFISCAYTQHDVLFCYEWLNWRHADYVQVQGLDENRQESRTELHVLS